MDRDACGTSRTSFSRRTQHTPGKSNWPRERIARRCDECKGGEESSGTSSLKTDSVTGRGVAAAGARTQREEPGEGREPRTTASRCGRPSRRTRPPFRTWEGISQPSAPPLRAAIKQARGVFRGKHVPPRPIFPRTAGGPHACGGVTTQTVLSPFADVHGAPSSLPLAFPCLSPGHPFFLRRTSPGKAPRAFSMPSGFSELRPDVSKRRERKSAGGAPPSAAALGGQGHEAPAADATSGPGA